MDAKLNLSRREAFGKKAKTLVADGNVLANIYGKGEDSIAAYGPQNIVEKTVGEAGKNHPITITLDDGKEVLALVHEVERDNVTRRMHHVTFQKIIKGQKVTTEVPIHQIGEAPAVRQGRIIVTFMDHVEIEAIPAKIPEALEVSIEGLDEDGDMVTFNDVTMPEGVELQVDLDQPIAKVETPRAEIEQPEEEVDAADVPSEHGSEQESDEGSEEKSE